MSIFWKGSWRIGSSPRGKGLGLFSIGQEKPNNWLPLSTFLFMWSYGIACAKLQHVCQIWPPLQSFPGWMELRILLQIVPTFTAASHACLEIWAQSLPDQQTLLGWGGSLEGQKQSSAKWKGKRHMYWGCMLRMRFSARNSLQCCFGSY